jgi:hypothetical protein
MVRSIKETARKAVPNKRVACKEDKTSVPSAVPVVRLIRFELLLDLATALPMFPSPIAIAVAMRGLFLASIATTTIAILLVYYPHF